MKKYLFFALYYFLFNLYAQQIDLPKEYSLNEFKKGISSFHNGEYELAIIYFTKALSYKPDNFFAFYFLGEAYRKAGYEKNALSIWNNLLAMGFNDRIVKQKVYYLYLNKGNLSEININKNFLIKKDLKGYSGSDVPPLFIKPSQIAINNENHYFIPCFISGYVIELDPNFHLVKNHFPIGIKLERPFGVAIDKENNLYVSDFKKDYIVKFDKLGIVKKIIGYKGIGESSLLGPEYILLDDEENLYVTDTGNAKINKYTKEGIFILSFGNKITTEEKLKKPKGLFYYNGFIYVCDSELNKVFIFDKNGNFIESFGENILYRPYQVTIDKFKRFLIVCENDVWIYEKDYELWYKLDELTQQLKKGASIVNDKENNILLTDFNDAKFIVLSPERERYTNLNVNIERIYSYKFPDIFFSLTVRKDDMTKVYGIKPYNLSIFENGKLINEISDELTSKYNNYTDIVVIIDSNERMKDYKNNIKILLERWLKTKRDTTKLSILSFSNDDIVFLTDFNSSILTHLDAIEKIKFFKQTDKGNAIKSAIYKMLPRFSKKNIIIFTNSFETGNDFKKFSIENCIDLAKNNDIPIYVINFENGNLKDIFNFMSKKTEGNIYSPVRQNEAYKLISIIENRISSEIIFSYKSKNISRFGDEPITLTIEINYSGMKGYTKSIYFPLIY